MKPKRTLVVYYSSSGNTRKVANVIAADLGADLEEIHPQDPIEVDIKGKGSHNFLNMGRVVMGGMLKRKADLREIEHDPSDYDLVLVGTPVYANTLPTPVRAYLTAQKDRLPDVAFFCTGEDPNNAHIFELMQEACACTPVTVMPIHAPAVRDDTFHAKVEALIDALS
jgi:flavodoxin